MQSLTAEKMRLALAALDRILPRRLQLLVGGGGAMLLAHGFPLATADIDAVPKGMSSDELSPYVEAVAREMELPGDWLNPWFSSYTYVLPDDYSQRLIEVFLGKNLTALALGKEDLLIMKCFAHRRKDVPHARALIRGGAKTEFVYECIERLAKRHLPGTSEALDFLDETIDLEEA